MSAAITARGALVAAFALLSIAPAATAGQAGEHGEPGVFKEKKTCGKLGLPFVGRIDPAKTGSYSFGATRFRIDERTRLTADWSLSGGSLSTIIVRGGPLNAVHDVSGKSSGSIERPWRSPSAGKGKGHGWGLIHVVLCGPKPPPPPPPPHPEPAKGKLIVKKVTDPRGSQQQFPFTVSGAQSAPGLPASFQLTDGGSKELAGLPGGQYTVTEGAVSGWKLSSIRCELSYDKPPPEPDKPGHGGWGKPKPGHDHGHKGHKGHKGKRGKRARQSTGGGGGYPPSWPAPDYDLGTGSATVTVPAGKTVICVFNNEQPPTPPPGKLIVKKVTDPSDGQASFDFTVSSTQTVAGLPSSFQLGDGGSKELAGLPAGTYTITESAPQGWRLASVTCEVVNASAVRARAVRRGGRTRGRSHWGRGTTPPVVNVEAGSAEVVVPAGKTVVCTFRNVRGPAPGSGRIIVQKLTYPAGSTESFSFTIGGVPEGFELQDGGLQQVHGLQPGTYTITEAPKQGWQIASINCWAIDAPASAPAYDLAAGRATVQVVAGGTVICAYLNSQTPPQPPPKTGTIIVSKIAPGATSEAFGFTTGAVAPTPPLSPATFTLGNAQSRTFGGIPAGTYTVTEDAFIGWTLQQAACSDIGGSAGGTSATVTGATATVNLADGDIVWCVYTNARAAVPPPVTPPTPPGSGTGDTGKTGTTPSRSTARLSAPRRCVRGRYSIRVRGSRVSSIAVSLNGNHVKTLRGRSGSATYTVTMPISKSRVQRVRAVVRFRPGVAPSRRTLRATVVRCRAAQAVPKFTG